MNYQTFKQQRHDLVLQIRNCESHKHVGMYYDNLISLIFEYEELTKQMLEYIKQQELPISIDEDLENVIKLEVSEEDETWLQHYLSLGK